MKTIPVFFRSEMVAPVQGFSPSAAKPAQVVARWQELGLAIELHAPAPATVRELCLAHDERYVHDVLACRRPNGFGTTSAEVAASLPYTSGALLSAARFALAHRVAACAPCSGFHHAGWADGGGFCTFNGLVIAARALLEEGARRVGILDCDEHYGNGTADILERLALDRVEHFTAGEHFHRPDQVPAFFDRLANELERMRACDVVLYQAGADPHVDDPLGGWLTTEQLEMRDARVFAALRGVPLVWNLAGGYQRDRRGTIEPVLEIHTNTARACIAAA